VDNNLQLAIPIFKSAFPGCEALFAFDSSLNHRACASDALLVPWVNQNPGGQQARLRPDWIGSLSNLQAMAFPDDHPEPKLCGQANEIEQILRERSLWRFAVVMGLPFYLSARLVITVLAVIQLLKEVAVLAIFSHCSPTSLHRRDVWGRNYRHIITV